ncbi:SEC-C motif protein [compost metagenome]
MAGAVERVHTEHFQRGREEIAELPPEQWTMLPFFVVSAEDVAAASNIDATTVTRVLDAFTFPREERNAGFQALNDFNAVSATPLLHMPDGKYLSLQAYGLAEAVYDAPFYWMTADKAYRPTLAKNRGDFTEAFVTERLALVFGRERVFRGVDIHATKGAKAGEIDTLVVWGNRAIIVQAKSKRLTLEARRGNDQMIQDDFSKSVQEAYDQAIECANCLGQPQYTLKAADGRVVDLPYPLEEIYPVCIVSDHYPALSFQVRQFLKTVHTPRVQPPMVMDVFALDVMTEMLQSPLKFLSYLNRRVNYGDKLMASQELTILGYHLSQNLWMEPATGMMQLADDFTAGLDIAMQVRRMGVEGAATPPGILTRHHEATTLGEVIAQIEDRPDPATIDLGFLLLAASGDTIKQVSRGIDKLAAAARADGQHHDLTVAFGHGEAGLTVHINADPRPVAATRLQVYCGRRKYKERAPKWFGLCLRPQDCTVRFGLTLAAPWKQDDEMDKAIQGMQEARKGTQALVELIDAKRAVQVKVGRNDPCPCGSGLKYKKCHLR